MDNEAGIHNHKDSMKTPVFCLEELRTPERAMAQAAQAIGMTIGKTITLVKDPISNENPDGFLAHFEIH